MFLCLVATTGHCPTMPRIPRQLNYQPFHRDLDGLMAFSAKRKPMFDAGLIFKTSVPQTDGRRTCHGWVALEISTWTFFGLGSTAKDEKVKYVAEKTKGKVEASERFQLKEKA